jgi:tetratricopeptide (TPR) repeat protein/transcriptional regulator with XRE-family HTH domain
MQTRGDGLEESSSAVVIGRLLTDRRAASGLTQEQVADRAQLSVRALRNIESGLVTRPRRRTVHALIEVLGLGGDDAALLKKVMTTGAGDQLARIGVPVARALPAAPSRFVGRGEAVEHLLRGLRSGDARRSNAVLLVGAAGTGKTALALHVAHSLAGAFADGQIFLALGRDAGLTGVLARVLRMLGVSVVDVPADLGEQADMYRSMIADRRLLIIADNACAAEARLLMPGRSRSAVVFTSRSALTSLDDLPRIALAPFTVPEATELLAQLLGWDRVRREESAARRIISYCDGLPLALRVAGARLVAHPYRSLAWLADRLAVGHRRLDELTVDDIGVRTSLLSTCASLTPAAGRLLGRLGQIQVSTVPAWLAAAAMNVTVGEAERLLEELTALHLIEPVAVLPGGGERFVLHDLVHAFAGEIGVQHEPEAVRRTVQRRVLGAALRRAEAAQRIANRAILAVEVPAVDRWGPAPDREITELGVDPWFQHERGILVALTVQACDLGEIGYAYGIAHAMLDFFDNMRYDDDLLLTHQRVFDAATACGHDVARGYAAIGRAELNANHGRYDDVLPDVELAVTVFERHRAELPKALLYARCLLAMCRRLRGEIDEARVETERLVEVAAGFEDPQAEAAARLALGACLSASGDHEAAAGSFRRALTLYERAGVYIAMSNALMRLGLEQAVLGQHDDATATLTQALQICRVSGQPQAEPHILLALADSAVSAGRPALARRHLQDCAAILDERPSLTCQAKLHLHLGRVNALEHNTEEAGHHFARGQVFAVRAGAPGMASVIRRHLRELAVASRPATIS